MRASGMLRVIVPMKPVYEGKSRLAGVLGPESRAALCLHLLQHVLRAVGKSGAALETWVVGGDEWVCALASQESARWQADPGHGLNEAVSHAVGVAFEDGASGILVLPGDLGFLRPEDVDGLVALSAGLRCLVLARAVTDGGTNAILAPRGLMVGPCFGPGSFARHMEEALKTGIPVEVCDLPGLAFDLDTPDDMVHYRKAHPGLDEALAAWRQKLLSAASVEAGEARRSPL